MEIRDGTWEATLRAPKACAQLEPFFSAMYIQSHSVRVAQTPAKEMGAYNIRLTIRGMFLQSTIPWSWSTGGNNRAFPLSLHGRLREWL